MKNRIIKTFLISLSILFAVCIMPAKAVYADDLEAVLAAQQAAKAQQEYEAAQRAAAQAESDLAYAMAQQRAKQEEAAALYAKWGEVPEYMNEYLNPVTPSVGMSQGIAVPSAVPSAPVVGKSALPGGKVVDLIIFAGQSNMSGAGGNAGQAPAVPNGCGYEFRSMSDPTGLYPVTEPFGVREVGYIGENAAVKHGSLVSSFVNTYYKNTGVPVVAVSASRGATDTNYWCGPNVRAELLSRYTKANSFLAANNITVRRRYLVWLQGESDAVNGTAPEQYKKNLNTAFSSLFASGLNQVFIITPGYVKGGLYTYDGIIKAQENLCSTDSRYTLASELLRTLPDMYLADPVHYNQQALNMVGAEAARVAATFTKITTK